MSQGKKKDETRLKWETYFCYLIYSVKSAEITVMKQKRSFTNEEHISPSDIEESSDDGKKTKKKMAMRTIMTSLDQDDYDEKQKKAMVDDTMNKFMKMIQESTEAFKQEQDRKDALKEKNENDRSNAMIALLQEQVKMQNTLQQQQRVFHQQMLAQNAQILCFVAGGPASSTTQNHYTPPSHPLLPLSLVSLLQTQMQLNLMILLGCILLLSLPFLACLPRTTH